MNIFDQFIEEQSQSINEAISQVKESSLDTLELLVKNNDHTGARIFGAKILKLKNLEAIYQSIETILTYEGSLPPTLNKYRADVDKRLFAFAKKNLESQQYKRFVGAF